MKRNEKSRKETARESVLGVDFCKATKLHPKMFDVVSYLLIKTAMRLKAQVDAKFEPFGIVSPQFGMMRLLSFEGALTQVELGEYMMIDKATMVRLLDGLEERGYVKRVPSATDRRAKLIELTASGLKQMEKMLSIRNEVEKQFLSILTAAERDQLKEIMKKLMA